MLNRLLGKPNPSSYGGNRTIVNQEQHVPARWRDVWILRNFRSHDSSVSSADLEIHKTLASVERMSGYAISDQVRPANIRGLWGGNLNGLPIGALRRRCGDRGTWAFEEIRRAENLQAHLFFGVVVPLDMRSAIRVATGSHHRPVGQEQRSGMIQARYGRGRHRSPSIGRGIIDFRLQARQRLILLFQR